MHRRCALYAVSRASLVEPQRKSAETRATPSGNTVAFGVAVLSLKGENLGSFPSLSLKEGSSWEDLPSSV